MFRNLLHICLNFVRLFFPFENSHHRLSQIDTLPFITHAHHKSPLNLIQALPLSLNHKEITDNRSQCATAPKQEIRRAATLIQQNWTNKRHEPITDPVESVG